MPNFPKMSDEETNSVNLVYSEIQATLSRFELDVNVGHVLTALTLLTIGLAAGSELTREDIADQFDKLSQELLNGHYDDFIQKTILLNAPTDDPQ